MFPKRTIFIATFLMLFCISSIQISSQAPTIPRSRKNKIVFDGDMAALLAQLADRYQVNIGLETDPAQLKTNIKIDFWFDTLDDILDGIVQVAPRYRWQNQDGFIDFYPSEASCALLETVVGDLLVDNSEWLAASEALTTLPEVSLQMNALGLKRRDLVRRRPAESTFSVNLKNVKLRRALHEITMKSNHRFWMFQRYGNDGRLFSITNSNL